jgi:hypothetical protein
LNKQTVWPSLPKYVEYLLFESNDSHQHLLRKSQQEGNINPPALFIRQNSRHIVLDQDTSTMFLKSALTLFLASNSSAFFVSPGVGPRPYVCRQVSLSTDPTLSTDSPSESDDVAGAPKDVEASAAADQEERHTIYVGNLPYGKSR